MRYEIFEIAGHRWIVVDTERLTAHSEAPELDAMVGTWHRTQDQAAAIAARMNGSNQ
jgi:hypothetical protein